MTTIHITRATIRERLAVTDHCTPVLTRGDTRTLPIVIDGRTYYREPCTLDGCTNPIAIITTGLCRSHYYRQKRWGDPRIAPARGRPNPPSGPAHPSYKPIVGYSAAHYRIRALKGLANQHPCADCGREAQDWSYDGGDNAALTDPRDGYDYSLDPDHYEARCRPCHSTFDAARHGHRRERPA